MTASLAAVAGIVGAVLVVGWTPAFVVVIVDQAVVNATPAPVVNASIQYLGEAGHLLHWTLSLALVVGLFGTLALLAIRASGRSETTAVAGWGTGVAVGCSVLLLTGALVSAGVAGLSAGLVAALGRLAAAESLHGTSTARGRRRLLRVVAGVVGYGGLGGLVGGWQTERRRRDAAALDRGERVNTLLDRAEATALGLDSIPGPVSTIDEFYTVDIASAPPLLSIDDWSLTVDGAVGEAIELSYADLRSMEAVDRPLTLRCIGDRLNGRKLDTAVWTCVPVSSVLDRAVPKGEFVTVRGADGYRATFPRSFLEDGLLAYGMNGDLLPRAHGYPVRLLVPGRWGKLNVKWLTGLTITTEKEVGYWEERGWEGETPVNTTATLWHREQLDDGRVELGGFAYAGTRGIDRVEVSVDGGGTWTTATLADALPGDDVARQWRYAFEPDGRQQVLVRAVDGTGTVQERERTEQFPDGPTGWVGTTIDSG